MEFWDIYIYMGFKLCRRTLMKWAELKPKGGIRAHGPGTCMQIKESFSILSKDGSRMYEYDRSFQNGPNMNEKYIKDARLK